MLRILYETGIRRGELLSLKFNVLQESAGGDGAFLQIERNHLDQFDLTNSLTNNDSLIPVQSTHSGLC